MSCPARLALNARCERRDDVCLSECKEWKEQHTVSHSHWAKRLESLTQSGMGCHQSCSVRSGIYQAKETGDRVARRDRCIERFKEIGAFGQQASTVALKLGHRDQSVWCLDELAILLNRFTSGEQQEALAPLAHCPAKLVQRDDRVGKRGQACIGSEVAVGRRGGSEVEGVGSYGRCE